MRGPLPRSLGGKAETQPRETRDHAEHLAQVVTFNFSAPFASLPTCYSANEVQGDRHSIQAGFTPVSSGLCSPRHEHAAFSRPAVLWLLPVGTPGKGEGKGSGVKWQPCRRGAEATSERGCHFGQQ